MDCIQLAVGGEKWPTVVSLAMNITGHMKFGEIFEWLKNFWLLKNFTLLL